MSDSQRNSAHSGGADNGAEHTSFLRSSSVRCAAGAGMLLLLITAAALFGVMKVQDAAEAGRSAQRAGESLASAARLRADAERVYAISANITSASAPSLTKDADALIKSLIEPRSAAGSELAPYAEECAEALTEFGSSLDGGSEQAAAARTLAEAAVNSLRELREMMMSSRTASARSVSASDDVGAEHPQRAEGVRGLLSAISRRVGDEQARGGLIRFMRTTDDITANVNMALGMCDAETANRSGYIGAAELAEAALAGCDELAITDSDGDASEKAAECRTLLGDLIACINTLAERQSASDAAASRLREVALKLSEAADSMYAEAENRFSAAMTAQADGINSAFFPPAFMLVAAAAGVLTILVTAFRKAVSIWRGIGTEFAGRTDNGPLIVTPAPPPSITAKAASPENADGEEEHGEMNRYRSALRSVSDMTKRATGIIKTNSALLKNGITAADNLSDSLEASARETSECAELLSDMAKAAKLASDSIHEAVSAMSAGMQEGEDGRTRAENALGRIESLAFSIASVSGKAAKLADGVRSESAWIGPAGQGLSAVAVQSMRMAEDTADAAGEIRSLTASMMEEDEMLSGVSCSAGALGRAARGVGDAAALIDDAMVKMESAVDRMKDITAMAEAHASAGREMASCIDGAMGTYSGVLNAFNGIGTACEID